jgi:hypothetical protein
MATFAMCQDSQRRTFWINVDTVRIVEQVQDYTVVRFDKDHAINVSGPAATILAAAKGS